MDTYTSTCNPTIDLLKASGENLEGRSYAVTASCGMLAVTQVLPTLLQSGGRVVDHSSVYNWTDTFLLEEAPKFGIQTVQVDMRDTQVLQSDGRDGQYISLPGASAPT